MYAVIKTGGKQHRVSVGDVIAIEKISGDKGEAVVFDQVLMVEKDGGELMAGAPFLAGARVVAVVDGVARGPKIRVFKKDDHIQKPITEKLVEIEKVVKFKVSKQLYDAIVTARLNIVIFFLESTSEEVAPSVLVAKFI